MTPKVSVIVPVYNVGQYVRKCIESVLNQTMSEWQLILVDDGSKDESAQIVDEYTDRRITVIHKKNAGVTAARADGLAIAEAEYVFFLDADDYLADNTLELCYNKAIETNADVVVGDFIIDWGNRQTERKFARFGLVGNVDYMRYCLINCDFYYTGRLYRKILLKESHKRIPFDITYGEDNVAVILFASSIQCAAQVEAPVLYYVQRAESVTNRLSRFDLEKRNRALVLFSNMVKGLSFYEQIKDALNGYLAKETYAFAVHGFNVKSLNVKISRSVMNEIGTKRLIILLAMKFCPALTTLLFKLRK